jgi:hypothetical protein
MDEEFDLPALRYNLREIDFPADRADLLRAAEENGAPEWIVELFSSLPEDRSFESSEEVLAQLREEGRLPEE